MGQRTDAVNGRDRTDEIRREIARTQQEMSRTIDAIQHRLSPHSMMERTKHSMKEAGVNVSRSFMDKVRDNPIPAAMVGVGLFLLIRDSGHGDGYDVEFIPDRAGWDADFDHGHEGTIAETRDKVQGAVSTDRARRLRLQARSRMSRARTKSRDVFQDNPLIAGLAALAAGAVLGALIPESDREHELMGDTRDRLVERATEKAREGVSRAKDVAGAAASAATEAARDEMKSQQRQEKTDIAEPVGIGSNPPI